MAQNTRTVFITGTSSGIGRATAQLFARKRWNVVATMRNPDDAAKVNFASGANVQVLTLDVIDKASIDTAVAQATERFGGIDVLVNNAGYGLNGPVEGASNEDMRRQFDVNFFGLIDVTNTVLPGMRERGHGLVINISSIGGRIGMPGAPFYISSKFAVEGLTESQRFELKPFGVRMKLIEPGGIKTDFISRSSRWTDHPDYADQIASTKQMAASLNDNLADPADVAKVVYRAATDRSERLRYTAKPGPYLMLYGLLSDRLWRGMIQSALNRHARG